jgi:hypothetical protein
MFYTTALRILSLAGLAVSCGPMAESKTPTRSALRAEAEIVLAMRAPIYAGTGEKSDAPGFLKTEVRSWISRRKRATDALIGRYEVARSTAVRPGAAALYGDVAELLLDFCSEFIRAGAAGAPHSVRADPDLYQQYVAALTAATVPQLERTIREAETCLAVALPEEIPTIDACRKASRDASALKRKAPPGVRGLDGAVRL